MTITCTRQFGDDAVDVGLLPFEPLDALAEFCERDLELRHLPVAKVIEVEHLAHFLEREADRLAGEHVGEPRPVAPRVEPLLAAPRRVEQALLLIEAQRARGDAEFLGEVADCEDVAPPASQQRSRPTKSETGGSSMIELGHAMHPDDVRRPVYIHPVYVNVKIRNREKFTPARSRRRG